MPSSLESFGQQLKAMRKCIYVTKDGRLIALTQADLWSLLGFGGDHKRLSRLENDHESPSRGELFLLVKFFAGYPGCLATPAEAVQWAQQGGITLEPEQLRLAFKPARPAAPDDIDTSEADVDPDLRRMKKETLGRITDQQISEALGLTKRPEPPPLTADQLQSYRYLLAKKVYAPWEEMYVPPEADEVLARQAPSFGGPGFAKDSDRELYGRTYDHIFQEGNLSRRVPLERDLLGWFLEKQQLVLTADPGCGKSTVLEEMARELASQRLKSGDEEPGIPVLISLRDYDDTGQTVAQFLPAGLRKHLVDRYREKLAAGRRPNEQQPALPDPGEEVDQVLRPFASHLEALRRAGRLILLLDGLNELPWGARGRLRPQVAAFVEESCKCRNAVAVACRAADYVEDDHDAITGLPRVELNRFDLPRIQDAVRRYLSEAGYRKDRINLVLQELDENTRLREMLEIPLYVRLLCTYLRLNPDERHPLPVNRGDLLIRFARSALEYERKKAKRAIRGPGSTMPTKDELVSALAEMAYRMRDELGSRGTARPLGSVYPFLREALSGKAGTPEMVLALAEGACLLIQSRDEDNAPREITFWKEPVEEALAARHLLARFAEDGPAGCQALWRVPLERGAPALADRRKPGQPPEYPQTGGAWEETTILAAGLAEHRETGVEADAFVRAVLAINPELAGRCLLEGGADASEPVRDEVRQELLRVLQDRRYSVRVRIPCGVLLGRLDDPRFHGQDMFCLPREGLLGFVAVPEGPFRMGSDRGTVDRWNAEAERAGWGVGLYEDELAAPEPRPMPLYLIGRYPVTNAQFRCFVADGGYSDRWRDCWSTAGRRWLDGERWSDDLNQLWQQHYESARKQRGRYAEYADYDAFRDRALKPYLESLRHDAEGEGYWANDRYNAPNQPVVGVTWYEAAAYASWLGRQLAGVPGCPEPLRQLLVRGWKVRLASEPEWEKAARGGLRIPGADGEPVDNLFPVRQWPWGEQWDAGCCNSAEGDEAVRWLSPVGAYPEGRSPYGCWDMVGNAWLWTRSFYDSYPYPSDPADRRAREDPEEDGWPVVRGGSWFDDQGVVRCAVRYRNIPDFSNFNIGFRVVVSLSDPGF